MRGEVSDSNTPTRSYVANARNLEKDMVHSPRVPQSSSMQATKTGDVDSATRGRGLAPDHRATHFPSIVNGPRIHPHLQWRPRVFGETSTPSILFFVSRCPLPDALLRSAYFSVSTVTTHNLHTHFSSCSPTSVLPSDSTSLAR